MAIMTGYDLPPVTGRHRDRALAEARRVRAANMIVSGRTYQQVADRLGYQNRGTVHRLVQPLLRTARPRTLDEAFELHVARLEGLLAAYYDQAINGDSVATKMVIEILRQETSLLGLFADGGTAAQDDTHHVIDPAELVRGSQEQRRQPGPGA